MTAIKIETFSGIAPRYSDRLLPPQMATTALNCTLLSGELRGLHAPVEVKNLTSLPGSIRRTYRIPNTEGYEAYEIGPDDLWLAFSSMDVDVVKSPIVNDLYSRYYWTGVQTYAQYNTKARIAAALPAYRLGVPIPVSAPYVTAVDKYRASVASLPEDSPIGTVPVGTEYFLTVDQGDPVEYQGGKYYRYAGYDVGGWVSFTKPYETRAYVYTFVTEYGEEGPPSEPTVLGGDSVGSWTLTDMDVAIPDTDRLVTKKRIYRTVPGKLTTSFYFVEEIDLSVASWTDSYENDVVASNRLLESTTWVEPPDGLQGIVMMPNGYMVGFKGRNLYFSEPYRPHAWPEEYTLSVEHDVVGMAVMNGSLVICTEVSPYVGYGVSPSSFTMQKLGAVEPCVSKRSIVASINMVMYASPNGIVGVTPSSANLITYELFTKEEWQRTFAPSDIFAVMYGNQYVAFNSPNLGFIFSPAEQTSRLTRLDRFESVDGLDYDQQSGNVFIIRGKRVLQWDTPTADPLYYTWRSKTFVLPKPVNFGAVKIKFNDVEFEIDEALTQYYAVFNVVRITETLSAIGSTVMAGVRRMNVPDWVDAQNRSPVGGSPILSYAPPVPGIHLTVYAREKVVFTRTVYDERIIRLPAGFKSDTWQFELIGNADLYALHVAETGKELVKI